MGQPCLSPELAPVCLAVEEKALRKNGNDAVRSAVIQSCAWLEAIQFTRLANWKGFGKKKKKRVQGRFPWSKEVLKEGSDTKQYVVLGRLLQAVAVMGTVSNRQARGTELFSH